MKKKILIFGANGVLGKSICNFLKKDYQLYGIDIHIKKDSRLFYYSKFSEKNLLELYKKNKFYCVIHCQQFKGRNFLNQNQSLFNSENFDEVISTNLKITLMSSDMYLKSLNKKMGRIINFSSTYGLVSSNPSLYRKTEMFNPIYYTISKFGVVGLTKYIASHYKKYRILCNSISPHGIENKQSNQFKNNFSERSPMGRLSYTKEVLPAINFLLNEQNTYTNGANIAVDGGWTAC